MKLSEAFHRTLPGRSRPLDLSKRARQREQEHARAGFRRDDGSQSVARRCARLRGMEANGNRSRLGQQPPHRQRHHSDPHGLHAVYQQGQRHCRYHCSWRRLRRAINRIGRA